MTRRAQREVQQAFKHMAIGLAGGLLISAAIYLPLILN